mmetsp:Transcript_7003/g.20320  ORF Transcript_7003/g.20320 Transcript_7003/m.20320 type:complete len:485 (-) Transcript_7003:1667-3121(-)
MASDPVLSSRGLVPRTRGGARVRQRRRHGVFLVGKSTKGCTRTRGFRSRFVVIVFLGGVLVVGFFLLAPVHPGAPVGLDLGEARRQDPDLDVSDAKGGSVRVQPGKGRAVKGGTGMTRPGGQIGLEGQTESEIAPAADHQSVLVAELVVRVAKGRSKDLQLVLVVLRVLLAALAAVAARGPQESLTAPVPPLVGALPGLGAKGPKDFSLDGFYRQDRVGIVVGGRVFIGGGGGGVYLVQEPVQGGPVPDQAVLQPKGVPLLGEGQVFLEAPHEILGQGVLGGKRPGFRGFGARERRRGHPLVEAQIVLFLVLELLLLLLVVFGNDRRASEGIREEKRGGGNPVGLVDHHEGLDGGRRSRRDADALEGALVVVGTVVALAGFPQGRFQRVHGGNQGESVLVLVMIITMMVVLVMMTIVMVRVVVVLAVLAAAREGLVVFHQGGNRRTANGRGISVRTFVVAIGYVIVVVIVIFVKGVLSLRADFG